MQFHHMGFNVLAVEAASVDYFVYPEDRGFVADSGNRVDVIVVLIVVGDQDDVGVTRFCVEDLRPGSM